MIDLDLHFLDMKEEFVHHHEEEEHVEAVVLADDQQSRRLLVFCIANRRLGHTENCIIYERTYEQDLEEDELGDQRPSAFELIEVVAEEVDEL